MARVDDRRAVNGIHVLRTGSPRRDLPVRYGPCTTIYNRCNRWAKVGVWLRRFEALVARSPPSMQLIGSSIIRAQQRATGGKEVPDHAIGRSRGALNAKIRAAVDQDACAVRLPISPGQDSDMGAVPRLLEVCRYRARSWPIEATPVRRLVRRRADPAICRRRNLIERVVCKLEQFCRVATRLDKLVRNVLAAVLIASARLRLRAYESMLSSARSVRYQCPPVGTGRHIRDNSPTAANAPMTSAATWRHDTHRTSGRPAAPAFMGS